METWIPEVVSDMPRVPSELEQRQELTPTRPLTLCTAFLPSSPGPIFMESFTFSAPVPMGSPSSPFSFLGVFFDLPFDPSGLSIFPDLILTPIPYCPLNHWEREHLPHPSRTPKSGGTSAAHSASQGDRTEPLSHYLQGVWDLPKGRRPEGSTRH